MKGNSTRGHAALLLAVVLLCNGAWAETGPVVTGAAVDQAATGSAAIDAAPEAGSTNPSVAAAIADGISTHAALAAGATEMNPIMPTSPLGLLAMTGMKIGLAKYAETLPEEDKRNTIKTTTAIWGGAAVNNLLVAAAGASPFALLAGLLFGISSWLYVDEQYAQQDRQNALLASNALGRELEAE